MIYCDVCIEDVKDRGKRKNFHFVSNFLRCNVLFKCDLVANVIGVSLSRMISFSITIDCYWFAKIPVLRRANKVVLSGVITAQSFFIQGVLSTSPHFTVVP